MNIRPRIPIYLAGNIIIAPLWYIDRYGGRTALLGWNKNKRYDNANLSLMLNDHLNAGDLNTVYTKNKFYTDNPAVVSSDILSFYDSDGNGMSAKDYEKFYNSQADIIRSHWALNLTYGLPSAGIHNPLYRRMFKSRSNPDLTKGSDYNIGYQENQLKIEGSSTWLRRMDQYEKDDLNNPDRIHEITLKDGTKARYYKENNGNIRLLENNPPSDNTIDGGNPIEKVGEVTIVGKKKSFEVPAAGGKKYGFDWSKLSEGLQKVLGNPDLYATGRLVGNLAANEKIYGEALKGIRPNLMLTYQTHRLIVGDEATKQGFYRRAAQGQTKAARPFTSDADRLMAYQFEAKRVGDELRAQGDLADNQEIRRTSDESNQHQWANQQRATEVANANNASINQANSLKHNLLALKHAAQWSSIDNFLKEIEYRKRLQLDEDLAFDEEIFNLQLLLDLLTNPKILAAKKDYQSVVAKHTDKNGITDWDNDEVIEAGLKYKLAYYQSTIDLYRERLKFKRNRSLLTAKSGTKITRKKKDDLLYKSTRDVVEHFRRMSKMSSDAQNRKTPKIEKLASHPKGKAWRFQQGGLAPFVVYTPVSMGGETSRTTSSDSSSSRTSSSKKEGKSDILDMIKELFKEVVGKGLPSDVNSLYTSMLNFLSRSRMFGSEFSTDDIASMYVLQMLRLNLVLYLKGIHDKAEQSTILNNAINEFAITYTGKLVGYNSETGKISYVDSLAEAKKEGVTPLTNGLLLNLRASDPNFANHTELDLIAANGVGMTKIAEFLRAQLPRLGSSILDNTIEGYTKKDSKDIIEGLKLLLEAPEGDYKFTKSQLTKDLTLLANKAIQYLAGILPDNMKKVLNIRAELGGISASDLIVSLVSSGIDYENKSKLEFDAVTGKAAKDANGNSKESRDMKSNPLMLMIQEQGGIPRTYELITRDSNVKMSVDGTFYSEIPKIKEDMSLDKMLSESGILGILDSKQGITFGDQHISPELLKDVMYSNTGGIIVTLPCKIVNGHKEVNLGVRKTYEEAVLEVESKGLSKNSEEYYKALGEELKQKGLNSLLDNKGYPDKNKFGLFLVVEGYTTTKLKGLDVSSQYVEKVKNPDDALELRLIKALSTNDKKDDYSLDIDYWLFGDDVYRGSIFIPISNNLNASINSWGDLIKIDEAKELERKYLDFNKASSSKPSSSDVL